MTPKEALSKFKSDEGSRFQLEFSKFVNDHKHDVVVETGEGVSSVYLLNNVEGMRLYSVDPNPWSNFNIQSDRHFPIRKTSFEALKELYQSTGEWDFFLHDGNHDIKGMTYDLEMAYWCVSLRGFIACDDWSWGEDFLVVFLSADGTEKGWSPRSGSTRSTWPWTAPAHPEGLPAELTCRLASQ